MRYPKILIGLVAAGLLTTGCGSDDGSSGSSGNPAGSSDRSAGSSDRPAGSGDGQKALPVAVDGPQEDVVDSSGDAKLKVTPAPENGAPFTQKVEHKLRETVLRGVMVPGETSAECADGVTQQAGAVSQCVVTYEGAEIPTRSRSATSTPKAACSPSTTPRPRRACWWRSRSTTRCTRGTAPKPGTRAAASSPARRFPSPRRST
ncbi:hypothetical protein ACR6C2_22015 [Streptomyces sp. INA 01156]